jgi:inorganic pyrophosphatase
MKEHAQERQELLSAPRSLLPAYATKGAVNVIIEIARGGRVKYKYDERHGVLVFHKILPQGLVFPFNFGSIPETLAPDGDPLDVVVLLNEELALGSVVRVRLVSVIEAEQETEGKTTRNDRLIGTVYEPSSGESPSAPSKDLLDRIESFFVTYNAMQKRKFTPLAQEGPDRARDLLEQGIERRRERHAPTKACRE